MVPSSKTTHRFPNRRRLQEGATLRDKARASWSSFALRATQAHRLDFGLAELVRPVALRRVSHSRSDFPYARPSRLGGAAAAGRRRRFHFTNYGSGRRWSSGGRGDRRCRTMLMSASPGRGGAKVRSARVQRGTGSSIATAQQHQWRVGRAPIAPSEPHQGLKFFWLPRLTRWGMGPGDTYSSRPLPFHQPSHCGRLGILAFEPQRRPARLIT